MLKLSPKLFSMEKKCLPFIMGFVIFGATLEVFFNHIKPWQSIDLL